MTVDARSSGRPAYGDSSNALPQLWGRRGLWQIRLRWAVAPLMAAGVWIAVALGFELRAALGLARALAAVGDRPGAVPVLREALQPFPTVPDNIDQREAAALLAELEA